MIGAALGLGAAANAQGNPPPSAPAASAEHGMMGDSMPNMMGRMNRMMDQCERMMKSKEKQ